MYSWHQSHDQTTVLFIVPSDTDEQDISVSLQHHHLIAGLHGQPPILKGRLYAPIDTTNSVWQLEPRLSHRTRTTSTTSTTSTQSSYAIISEPDILVSEPPSPGLSSPCYSEAGRRTNSNSNPVSRSVSPGRISIAPLFSSLESLSTNGDPPGRLVTLHLEKESPAIWPSLISGGVEDDKYDMDPTSLTLTALELFDIRKDKEEAFEYFLRAWHLAHVPTATMKLVTYYLPIHVSYNIPTTGTPSPGTTSYYLHSIGGPSGLARLYFEAGMLYLEGTANGWMHSSHGNNSSARSILTVRGGGIKMPLPENGYDTLAGVTLTEENWRRDQVAATRLFDRAKVLEPLFEGQVPTLLGVGWVGDGDHDEEELEMPRIELNTGVTRRRREHSKKMNDASSGISTSSKTRQDWYIMDMIPGLVGAGTALVVVGVVGVLSFSSWSRRNQS